MNSQEMSDLMQDTFKHLMELKRIKAGEYADDDDALSNFRRNAAELGLSMEMIWRVFAGKHWDAISRHVRDLNEGRSRELSEPIEGRIDDLIVYLCILKGILRCRTES